MPKDIRMLNIPRLLDVIDAKQRINSYITRTPIYHYRSLDAIIGAQVYVKHENHQHLGSFKVRGSFNVLCKLVEENQTNGLVVASTGNFGQGIAYAASVFGLQANVVVPINANLDKVESMRQLGANLIFHGQDFDDSRQHAEMLAKLKGYRYVHSANEPMLISGVGTYALEIVEDLSDVDVVIVPIGGGSGVCGTCIVTKSVSPDTQVIGVQSSSAPGAYRSWKEGKIVKAEIETVAEGLATGEGFNLTQSIMRDMMDDFILVSEEELDAAVVLHLQKTHNLTEHAGAASLAAALKIKDRLQGKKVVLVLSGGNITLDQLRLSLERRKNTGIA